MTETQYFAQFAGDTEDDMAAPIPDPVDDFRDMLFTPADLGFMAAARENAALEAAQQPTHGAAALKDFTDAAPAYAVGDTVTYRTIVGRIRTVVVTAIEPNINGEGADGFVATNEYDGDVWGYDSDILSVTPAVPVQPAPVVTKPTRIADTSLTAAQERLVDSIQFDGYTLEQNKWALRYSLWDGGTFIRTVPAAMVKKLVANGWLKEVPSQRKYDASRYVSYVIATR